MTDLPWLGDACGLVDEFRAGRLSPVEALEASLRAIDSSALNACSHVDAERALDTARGADVALPFGGVPFGVKELERVAGWPHTEASLVFKDRVSEVDQTSISRLRAAGAVLAAQTTASEFGGINCTSTRLHGTTRNPWDPARTPGGSSGGTAAAVAGGLVPIATGSDGGGSIRIPAGFCGLFGLKANFGRVPKGPRSEIEPLTSVLGVLTRSVRDTARWFDACNGFDSRDPYSLPRVGGWESGLGTFDLEGKTVAIIPDFGNARVRSEVAELVASAGEEMARDARLRVIDVGAKLPALSGEWSSAGIVGLVAELWDHYPECEDELTPEIRFGLRMVSERFDLKRAARIERFRRSLNEAMAEVFDEVDFVVSASNPDVAFAAEGPPPLSVGGVDLVGELGLSRAAMNNGALTAPTNLTGNPAASIPVGQLDGLPVGMQVAAAHHCEPFLLDLGLAVERERPWPKVAPGSPS